MIPSVANGAVEDKEEEEEGGEEREETEETEEGEEGWSCAGRTTGAEERELDTLELEGDEEREETEETEEGEGVGEVGVGVGVGGVESVEGAEEDAAGSQGVSMMIWGMPYANRFVQRSVSAGGGEYLLL